MVNIELWQLVLTAVSTLTVGGVITYFIQLWWIKRRTEAETAKQEEEAKQEHHHTTQASHEADTIAIQNAKLIIESYKTGFQDLKNLYEESNKELENRCKKLEDDLQELQKNTHDRIQQLEDEVQSYKKRLSELEDQLSTKCSSCEYATDCQKRIALGLLMRTKRSKSRKSSKNE